MWKLPGDWARFLEVELPGLTTACEWLSGGANESPSKFQFELGEALPDRNARQLSA